MYWSKYNYKITLWLFAKKYQWTMIFKFKLFCSISIKRLLMLFPREKDSINFLQSFCDDDDDDDDDWHPQKRFNWIIWWGRIETNRIKVFLVSRRGKKRGKIFCNSYSPNCCEKFFDFNLYIMLCFEQIPYCCEWMRFLEFPSIWIYHYPARVLQT